MERIQKVNPRVSVNLPISRGVSDASFRPFPTGGMAEVVDTNVVRRKPGRWSRRRAVRDVDKPPDRRGFELVTVTSITDAVRPPTSVEDTNRAAVGVTRRIMASRDHLVCAV
jgi:hypothetical protein